MSVANPPTMDETLTRPTWEVASLYPLQGEWSEGEYLILTDATNRRFELVRGYLEELTMPTLSHQRMFDHLYILLRTVARRMGGRVYAAGARVRLGPRHFREPDIVFFRSKRDPRQSRDDYADGADLVVEVVSGSAEDRERDLVKKRREYAHAGILEYWIVDPQTETLTVLSLQDQTYDEHGVFKRGEVATSVLLAEVQVSVDEIFDAE